MERIDPNMLIQLSVSQSGAAFHQDEVEDRPVQHGSLQHFVAEHSRVVVRRRGCRGFALSPELAEVHAEERVEVPAEELVEAVAEDGVEHSEQCSHASRRTIVLPPP